VDAVFGLGDQRDILVDVGSRLVAERPSWLTRKLTAPTPPSDELGHVLANPQARLGLGIVLGNWLDVHLLHAGEMMHVPPAERCSMYGTVAFLLGNNVLGPQLGKAFRGAPVTPDQLRCSGMIEGIHRVLPFGFQALSFEDPEEAPRAFWRMQNLLAEPGGDGPFDKPQHHPIGIVQLFEQVLTDAFNDAGSHARGPGELIRVRMAAAAVDRGPNPGDDFLPT
jgi:hypothetical protein